MVAATMARADSQTVAGKRFVGTARRRCLPPSIVEIASQSGATPLLPTAHPCQKRKNVLTARQPRGSEAAWA